MAPRKSGHDAETGRRPVLHGGEGKPVGDRFYMGRRGTGRRPPRLHPSTLGHDAQLGHVMAAIG